MVPLLSQSPPGRRVFFLCHIGNSFKGQREFRCRGVPYLRWLDVSMYYAMLMYRIKGSKERAKISTYLIWCHGFVEHLRQIIY